MSGGLRKLNGLIAATYAPMHDDGSLRLETIDALAERLVANNVNGAFLCDTTGSPACDRSGPLRTGKIAAVPIGSR